MKVLLIEDDIRLAGYLIASLNEHGFIVSHIASADDLVQSLTESHPADVILLDRLLGGFDSKQDLPRVREKWPHASILILSAISTPNERTELLNMGADDYLGKPFSTSELIARIRASLRRTTAPAGNYVQLGNLVVDLIQRSISVDGHAELLPSKEFQLLRTLIQKPGRIWSKNELLDYVWGQAPDVGTNVVEATVANLRKKLQELYARVNIKNMRNSGYWIEE
jgi:DNA-binding response OmpR family regulator